MCVRERGEEREERVAVRGERVYEKGERGESVVGRRCVGRRGGRERRGRRQGQGKGRVVKANHKWQGAMWEGRAQGKGVYKREGQARHGRAYKAAAQGQAGAAGTK